MADENFGALILVFDSDLINILVEGNILLEGLIVDAFEIEEIKIKKLKLFWEWRESS